MLSSMTPNRVVITGLGTVCAAGGSVDETWATVLSSEPKPRIALDDETRGLPRVKEIDFSGLPVRKKEVSRMNRGDALGVVSACHAALNAGWTVDDPGERKGLYLGTTKDTASSKAILLMVNPIAALGYTAGASGMIENATRYLTPFALLDCMPNLALHYVANTFKLRGDNSCFLHTGAAGSSAIMAAFRAIRAGRVDSALAGGFDSTLDRLNIARFASLGLLSEDTGHTACRPFDRHRDGFVLGEAGAMLVLEDRQLALERDATIYGEVLGVGSACAPICDAKFHSGQAVELALKAAFASAGVPPESIDFIVANGDGTVEGDLAESAAIHDAFAGAARQIPVTAFKGVFGHVLAAAGALEAIMALKAMSCGEIPPAYGCDEFDERCAVRLVRGRPLSTGARRAVVISTGIGGQACALILERGI